MSSGSSPPRPRFPVTLDSTRPKAKRFVAAPPGANERRISESPATRRPAAALTAPRVSDPLLPQALVRRSLPNPPDAARAVLDPGTYELAGARLRMIERLQADGCHDLAVLQAMAVVPRHLFLDPGLRSQAYEDTSLPIGQGQTISKPTVVARMLALALGRCGAGPVVRALEIGTGCGYQAAVMTLLARQVISVERLQSLYERARENLAPMRPDHLRLVLGDGRLGHAPNAPYDIIVSAAGGASIPAAWLEQLALGGRLVAPSTAGDGQRQVLVVVDRGLDGLLVRAEHEAVRFVPLESGTAVGTSI